MFGLGFGEMVLVAIVLIVVVGPRELPRLLRSLGQGITKLRRMTVDLRQQSGIDEILREEGLREDLDAIRSLSRGNVVESLVNASARPARSGPRRAAPTIDLLSVPQGEPPEPEVEYPEIGCDAYGAKSEAPEREAEAPEAYAPDAPAEGTAPEGTEGEGDHPAEDAS